jgi:hypothetical protein
MSVALTVLAADGSSPADRLLGLCRNRTVVAHVWADAEGAAVDGGEPLADQSKRESKSCRKMNSWTQRERRLSGTCGAHESSRPGSNDIPG